MEIMLTLPEMPATKTEPKSDYFGLRMAPAEKDLTEELKRLMGTREANDFYREVILEATRLSLKRLHHRKAG